MDQSLYFLFGEEEYLLADHVEQIINEVQGRYGEDTEVVSYFADELTPAGFMNALDFSPLFNLSRIAVFKKATWFAGKKKKGAPAAEFQQVFELYMSNPAPGQVVIITAKEYLETNSFTKLLKSTANCIPCDPYSKEQRRRWLQGEAKAKGKSIQKEVLAQMANSNFDLNYLKQWLDKLCLVIPGDQISLSDVEYQWGQEENIKVFPLLDALLSQNLEASMGALQQLLRQGEHPIFFLFMIVRQFLLLGKVKAMQEKGWDRSRIATATKQKDFVIRNLAAKTNNFTWPALQRLNRSFLETDLLFKSTGLDNNMLMENLIVEICTAN
jgi:DNA polymerase-3 subunit delta